MPGRDAQHIQTLYGLGSHLPRLFYTFVLYLIVRLMFCSVTLWCGLWKLELEIRRKLHHCYWWAFWNIPFKRPRLTRNNERKIARVNECVCVCLRTCVRQSTEQQVIHREEDTARSGRRLGKNLLPSLPSFLNSLLEAHEQSHLDQPDPCWWPIRYMKAQ